MTYGLTIPVRISGLSKIALDSSRHQEKDMRLPWLETSCTSSVGALMKVWIWVTWQRLESQLDDGILFKTWDLLHRLDQAMG